MPSVGEWVIQYPGVTQAFGPIPGGIFFTKAPLIGDAEIRDDDQNRPRMDGVAFGRDYRGGRVITFELGVDANTEAEGLARLSRITRAWRGDWLRARPEAVATLTMNSGSFQRTVFGRPRRFADDHEYRRLGYTAVVCDFKTVNDVFYSAENRHTRVGFVPPSSGGFLSPISSPLTTTAGAASPGAIEIGGDLPASLEVTLRGPIINPVVSITNQWSVALDYTIPAGVEVKIDMRPWARSVTRVSDGASLAGKLTRTSRLNRQLNPGKYEIVLRGIDETGLSSMLVVWRNAFSTLGGVADLSYRGLRLESGGGRL